MEPEALQSCMHEAHAGNPFSQFALGVCYLRGDGVAENIAEAHKWILRAAEQGHTRACFNIASMYLQGQGVPRDPAEAKVWFRRSFNELDPDLLFNMGRLIQDENDVLDDWDFAVRCYKMAADAGHAPAQALFGMMVFAGEGVPEDKTLGRRYVGKAAQQGQPNALCFLAQLYEDGDGHEPNLSQASFLYRLAAFHGDPEAEERRQSVDRKLSPLQVAEVEQRANAAIERLKAGTK